MKAKNSWATLRPRSMEIGYGSRKEPLLTKQQKSFPIFSWFWGYKGRLINHIHSIHLLATGLFPVHYYKMIVVLSLSIYFYAHKWEYTHVYIHIYLHISISTAVYIKYICLQISNKDITYMVKFYRFLEILRHAI